MMQVVAGLILKPGPRHEVLMALRPDNVKRPSLWEIPGGCVEPGESQQFALKRELREELGVEVEVFELLARATFSLEIDFTISLFHCEIVSGEPEPLASVAIRWMDFMDAIAHAPLVPSSYAFCPQLRPFFASLPGQD